jgi:hypothetical protein
VVVKFTERGCISITVFGRKKEGDRYEIHFPVKDTGIAIPEDKADRLSMLSASILDGSEVCSAYLWSFAGTSIHMLEEKLPGENATKIRALYKSSTGYEA